MRSLRPLVLAFVLAPVGALAGAGAASAQTPERFAFTEQDPGVIDCGGFEDHFTDFFEVKGTTFFGDGDAPVRMVLNVVHHSNDTNSVTGLTVHEHGHFIETFDLRTGTVTVTGNQEVANRPGTGVVVQDTGRIVFDADGNVVFFAGGRNHSEELLGDQVLCDALAP